MARGRKRFPRCTVCGKAFGEDRPRWSGSPGKCRECGQRINREYQRAHYRATNQYRLGKPRGPKPGQMNGQVMSDAQIAAAVAAARLAHAAVPDGPRQLPRTCPYCLRFECLYEMLTLQRCELDRVPDETGGCDQWEPRYRVDDEE